MPTVQQLRSRLLKKLTELFQLDQPDLDFGFYRIMHAKAQEVQEFVSTDLLRIVEEAFGAADEVRKTELKANIEKEIQAARDYGVTDPENSPKVKEARAAYDAVKEMAGAEAEVYDHLYRFFERYYDAGDFISRRYYTRETSGKAAPFAVPYNGEEVKLHWANADQYYIKSAEYFSNYTFDLRQASDVQALLKREENELFRTAKDAKSAKKVHFRIVEASEGEHGNVKASEATKRFFILHDDNPVVLNESGELVINFEYRPDPEKTGQENTWRDKRNAEAVQRVLHVLEEMVNRERREIHEKEENDADRDFRVVRGSVEEYLRMLKIPAGTESDKNRILLAKYLHQYTARNTMDYFIHKDLGGFLRRELDFYIKNEVMRLDDIENADAPSVESYLSKIKVLRRIAGKLIDFLAQLEDFQKKLWIKKKFVVETNYCITLDRVPEELYPEIAANREQHEEWVRLGFATANSAKKENDLFGYDQELTLSCLSRVSRLKENRNLVLDTRFFDEVFKAQLVASIENFDEQCDGLLIHSENFQALNLLQERYREQVKCVYVDPPYNTGNDEFKYKDTYQHSSWLSAMADKMNASKSILSEDGSFYCQLDHYETHHFRLCASEFYNFEREIIWSNESSSGFKAQANTWIRGHDTIYFFSKGKVDFCKQYLPLAESTQKRYDKIDLETGEKYKEYFEDDGSVRKVYLKDSQGKPLSTVWSDIFSFQTNNAAREHMAFSTQKPIELILRILKASNIKMGDIALDYFAGSGTTGHAVINLNREDGGKRKYILVEMGDYFDTVLKPRIAKVVYSESWRDGKPAARESGISHCFKYLRLESYEDTLNNLCFDDNPQRQKFVAANPSLKEDYMLHYLLDVETRGSQSLLNIDAFADPTAYTLKVKKPGTDEYIIRPVDLIETFNYLIGLRLEHSSIPQIFQAAFKRIADPELPEDQHTRLVVDGKIKIINREIREPREKRDEEPLRDFSAFRGSKSWYFRKVEGWVPKDPSNPNNGQREKVLIVWRKLTGNIEEDNLMLDEWFQKNRISTRDFEFDTIYVNGSNNLPNLKLDGDNWKVRLIEEEFMKRMWEVEG